MADSNKNIYSVFSQCSNCNFVGEVVIEKGKALPDADCPNCGVKGSLTKTIEKSAKGNNLEEGIKPKASVLGRDFEDMIEEILKSMGYKTETRIRLKGKSGAHCEIDVIATKISKNKEQKIAVECKNYDSNIGSPELRKFENKIEDIGFHNGIFAVLRSFSKDAYDFAQSYGIDLWNGDTVKEKLFLSRAGRISAGKSESLPLTLPIKVQYDEAVALNLQNKENVSISSANLLFHPYFVANYSLNGKITDPKHKVHVIKDNGKIFIDGIDGDILNPLGQLARIGKTFGGIFGNEESIEDTAALNELLLSISPEENYSVEGSENYEVKIIKPEVNNKDVEKKVTDEIIETRKQTIQYTVGRKSEDLFEELDNTRSIEYVPKKNEISIKNMQITYIPKWDITFESGNHIFSRKIFASSGKTIFDNISLCPKHFSLGKVKIIKVKTEAVCEICGCALCKNDFYNINGKILCQDDLPIDKKEQVKQRSAIYQLKSKFGFIKK